MAAEAFELVPFEASEETAKLSIKGKVSRKKGVLSIQYRLAGDLGLVAIPTLGEGGHRQDRLWEKTCFECFLSEGSAGYWEFNFSPSGDWNAFALTGYRQGLKEEAAISRLPVEAWQGFEGLQLQAKVPLVGLVDADRPLQLGVSAVVVLKSGEETFWAIAHPRSEADFHHPDSFAIAL
ncbi:MAG: DOMON-like domain-containing protein [Cyanobacteria bacterium J06623_5]